MVLSEKYHITRGNWKFDCVQKLIYILTIKIMLFKKCVKLCEVSLIVYIFFNLPGMLLKHTLTKSSEKNMQNNLNNFI